jgi:hypothetical protein
MEANPKDFKGDAYTMEIDPAADVWSRLGIRYVVLPFASTDPDFLSKAPLVLTLPEEGLWIYRYDWKGAPPNG